MTFSLWSLDFIYYPVSGIMWVWHKLFGYLFGLFGVTDPLANPWTWVLSVMFLVFTLRAIMFKPFMKQMDSSLKMQAIQPEMKRIREKYKDDRQRLTEEMMKLNKEAGVNPLASCLPALLQAPAFIGLFHVLRNFNISFQGGPGAEPGAGVINNYFFSASDVESFHDALLFGGATLSGHLTMSAEDLAAVGADRATMLWVGIPLMILAAIATHLTSRKSVARQAQMGTAASGQMAIMQKLMLYGFPLAVIVIGWFYPLALLFYWLANNTWTFLQLFVAHRAQDRKLAEESLVVEEAKEAKTYTKPKPGARPQRGKTATITPVRISESSRGKDEAGAGDGDGSDVEVPAAAEPQENGSAGDGQGPGAKTAGTQTGAKAGGTQTGAKAGGARAGGSGTPTARPPQRRKKKKKKKR